MIATEKTNNSVRIRIQRQDTPEGESYAQDFNVEHRPNSNVISCLQQIANNPKTAEGKDVSPVAWDCNCLEEVCGACTMVINGTARQSCSALVDELVKAGFGSDDNPIILEPMSKFPVVRDLFVDRSRMFENLKKASGWVPIDGMGSLGAGPKESQAAQTLRYEISRCMTCGCCLEACPQFTKDNDFVGAQTIAQTLYFNSHDTGKRLKDERLDFIEEPGGIADCGNAQNCVEVCPKDVPLTHAIAAIGRQTTVHAIKKFFMGK
jgi:succinate dehydrogenase / fumarate reductase, iron-sulfur subunit